jgi:ABC-type transport system involved in multi-copper enzyme maturation permease subunit
MGLVRAASKPITRADYVTGKLVTLAVYLFGVTLAPAMALLLLQVLLEGSARFLAANLFLIPAITLFSAIQVLVSAFAMLALSSLSKSHRFVAVMYAGLIFFTGALYQVLRAMTGSRVWAWISPEDTLDIVADAIFRVGSTPDLPVPAAFAVVGALIAASIVILERRIRAV